MNPVLLQKQLRDNAADVNEFYSELKVWGEDIKRKNQSLEKMNDSNTQSKAPKKQKMVRSVTEKLKDNIGSTDSWDKFDADAECEKIDYNENEDSDLTDEYDEALRDEAYVEKEKGNKFVKSKKWNEAITCYNKAIHCYAYDPVFYANRALCFLKKQEYVKAELDCTMSIRLDSTYTKALYRRAAAREGLGKCNEAEADLLKILELEPKNMEASCNLDALRKKLQNEKKSDTLERPPSKFVASRNIKIAATKNKYSSSTESPVICDKIDKSDSLISGYWHEIDDIILVKAVVKPIHLQSKKCLKRITIQETVEVNEKQCIKQSFSNRKVCKTDDLTVFERQSQPLNVREISKENKNYANNMKMNAA